jgi:hypothetical protein
MVRLDATLLGLSSILVHSGRERKVTRHLVTPKPNGLRLQFGKNDRRRDGHASYVDEDLQTTNSRVCCRIHFTPFTSKGPGNWCHVHLVLLWT